MDKLEERIRQMRPLNVDDPPEDSWDNIAFSVPAKKRPYKLLNMAAVILVLLVAGWIINIKLKSRQESLALGDISSEYRQMEEHYQQAVEALKQEIDFTKEDKKNFDWIFEELNRLEQMNQSYKRELAQGKNTEKIIPILIDYYEKKIRLLKKLEMEINRKKNEKSMIEYS